MEYYNNIPCLTCSELTDGIITTSNYSKMAHRGKLKVLRRGCYGTEALISFDSLPGKIKILVVAKYGNPYEQTKRFSLKENIVTDANAISFYLNYKLSDGRNLPAETQTEYTANASVLNAVHYIVNDRTALKKALGGSTRDVWKQMAEIVASLKHELKHSLPENHRRLKQKLSEYKTTGYESLISGKFLNKNAGKIVDIEHEAVLRQLLRKPTNLDNEQICSLYNIVAEKCEWDKITAVTVGNYRTKWKVETLHAQRGVSAFDNTMAMQVKRSTPVNPMTYWTMDGWDVELLYQKTETDPKGNSRTTYHNRLTVVIVLDPCLKYPIGYAIGTHETPELIKDALRNAVNHTAELFGDRYRVQQLQTDNYGRKTLTPIYEFVSKHYTPARVHNAKSKVIEPYFNHINRTYCQLYNNWSGFGVASGSKNQPNAEYLNKIRHSFPDELGCRLQIENIIRMEREKSHQEYTQLFLQLPSEEKLYLPAEEYLYMLGETTGYTNKLSAAGLIATIGGEKKSYDCFDVKFRQLSYIDWTLRYDSNKTDEVLAVDSTGSHRFLLQEKYVQPMALVERTENDATELQAIREFNKNTTDFIQEQMHTDYALTEGVFERTPSLEGTLSKLILCDSNGQHKDNRNSSRINPAKKMLEKQTVKIEAQEEKSWREQQDEYLNKKVNIDSYINQ